MKKSEGGSKIGFLGGAIGIVIGILYFLFAGIVTLVHLFHSIPVSSFVSSVLGVIFGLFALAAAGTARKDSAMGGVLLIVAAILGLYFVNGIYTISSVIVLIAGIVAIVDYVR